MESKLTNIKAQYQTLKQEIEIYRSHFLFKEAKKKCIELEELFRNEPQIKNKQKLLAAVTKKINDLEDNIRRFEAKKASAQMSAKELYLVRELFSSPRDGLTRSTAFDNAVALLIFGQFEQALDEFYKLLMIDTHRVAAAKNILRCHVGLCSVENATIQYHQWYTSSQFPRGDLKRVYFFYKEMLHQIGIDETLPTPEESSATKRDEFHEEEFIDLLSIKIPAVEGTETRREVKLDINAQKGEIISVIIPGEMQSLIDKLEVGKEIENVRFYSPAIVFNDTCIVSAIKPITSGPKKGDYTLIMKAMV